MVSKKKSFLLLLMTVVIVILVGCSDSEGDGYIYSAETLPLPEGLNHIDAYSYSNGYLYITYSGDNAAEQEPADMAEFEGYSDVQYWRKYAKLNISDGTWTEIPYESDAYYTYITSIEANKDGAIWVFERAYIDETDENGNITTNESYSLLKISEAGEVLDTVYPSYLGLESDDHFYIHEVLSDGDGNWYFRFKNETGSFVSVADSAGTEIFRLESENHMEKMVKTSTGDIVIPGFYYKNKWNNGYELIVIDEVKKDWGNKYPTGGFSDTGEFRFMLYNGLNYYVYLEDFTNFYGYDAETKSKTVLLNWDNNNIDSSMVHFVQPISDTQILCAVYSKDVNLAEMLLLLTKTDNEPVT